ncbi:hypothetical protein B296_00058129 [Ensete ventricosum]|uniref:Uncharacterized protein n=1 Tax=Ensete ventricosum TaxID=4639 RepID=A0A426WXE2_ENSVE|nr:hypothetical protein B296_00058129 [Ensete ventricosum]
MLRLSVTREWVGEGELPKERTQSEVAEAVRCAGRGHHREIVIQVHHKNLNAMEMSPGGDMVQAMIEVTGELDCFNAHIRLREPNKSEDKAEDGTSVESLIPCSYGGKALVVKGVEVENVEPNSKYQDKAEGQRQRNFLRPVSTGFLSR